MPFIFLFLQLCFAVFLIYSIFAFLSGAPFVPTTPDTARSMIALAGIKQGDVVYDLGSGNGKLLLMAAKKGARAVGFEINPLLVLLSMLRGTNTKWKNFWNAKIDDADIIFVYLLPWRMERLAKKLTTQCKPGAIIVSNSFIFPKWKILRQDKKNHVYVFRVT
jgi:SAM-dependent methyltransferase